MKRLRLTAVVSSACVIIGTGLWSDSWQGRPARADYPNEGVSGRPNTAQSGPSIQPPGVQRGLPAQPPTSRPSYAPQPPRAPSTYSAQPPRPRSGSYSQSSPGSRGFSTPSARGRRRPFYQNPPLSPYLNLYRADSGVLDNYHTFVQPQLQLYRTLGNQEAALQRQDAGIYRLRQDVSEYERAHLAQPTGTGSSFMNYSHFYPLQGGSQPRR